MGGNYAMPVASFDIFDTLLTRRVGDPRAAFLLLGKRAHARAVISCSAHAFARARRDAEVRAFRNAGGLDSAVSLQTIHRELANALHLCPRASEELLNAELELEAELLVPIGRGQQRLREARAAGQRIVFVSDMYLPSAFLRRQLDRHGLWAHGDMVFVSNEHERSKATGALWPEVLKELGVASGEVHHFGNDDRSDGTTARRAGLSATVATDFNLNRYEQRLEDHHVATDGLSSALAGASRLARLRNAEPQHQPIADVAAGVVAPFVIGNLLWTLGVAKRDGLKKLFFVARDGQVLCDVAEILAQKVGYTGELEYIYGSRQAWALAGITDTHDAGIDAMIPNGTDVAGTLTEVLDRFGIAPTAMHVGLESIGLGPEHWTRPLTPKDTDRLRHLIRTDHVATRLVRDRAKQARELVLAYLESVGAVTDEPIGFVDLGTGATLFNSLSSILATVGQQPPVGFYFGLRAHVPDSGFGRPLTYVRNVGDSTGFLHTPGLLTLVELACTADHGTVLGYEEIDGVVHPVCAADGNAAVVAWGLPVIHRTVTAVAEELLLDEALVGTTSIDLRPSILDVFELFWTSPTRAEAEAWGTYPFEDGWGDNAVRRPLATRRSLHHVLRAQPHRHWWVAGASRLSGRVTRSAFVTRHRAQRFHGRVQAARATRLR